MEPEASTHAWFARRLEAFRAGVLPEGEAEHMEEHLATCAGCRAVLEASPAGEAGRHVPASVLARWPGTAADLPALEREMVEHHLARCPACREALAIATAARTREVPGRVLPLDARRRPGAWLAAAAAAAAVIFVAGQVVPRRHAPGPPPAASFGAPLAIDVRAGSGGVRLRDVVRGAGAPAATALEPGPREALVLEVEAPDAPDDAVVTLELSRPAGGVLARTSRRERELYPGRRLVLGTAAAPVPDGAYLLRVIAHPAGAAADTQGYAFTVRRRR